MAGSKKTRDALLTSSVDALRSGRGATASVAQTGSSWIPTSEIMPDSTQPRTRFDPAMMATLVASIRALGQIEPIVVEPLSPEQIRENAPFRFRCVSGHRRLQAHAELGLDEIRAFVLREPLPPNQRMLREVAANEVREDHTDFDRARYMALILVDVLLERDPELGPMSSEDGVAAARRFTNRVFNDLDRSKTLGDDLRGHVDAFERRLSSLGERRNLRWFHRWGLPLLALEGAALEGALNGLDARRALAISTLSPRSGKVSKAERTDRETLVATVATLVRSSSLPHRETASLVNELLREIEARGYDASRLEAVVARWNARSTEDIRADALAPSEGKRGKRASTASEVTPSRRTTTPSLVERAEALARTWTLAPPDSDSGDAPSASYLVTFVERTARRAPRRAERFLKALERATKEIGEPRSE
jgi:ParB/RepB/Spo0J family partition protein